MAQAQQATADKTVPQAALRRPFLVLGLGLFGLLAGVLVGSRSATVYQADATVILEDPSRGSDGAILAISPDRYVNGQVAVFDLDQHHELAASIANQQLIAEANGPTVPATTLGADAALAAAVDGTVAVGGPGGIVLGEDGSVRVSGDIVVDTVGLTGIEATGEVSRGAALVVEGSDQVLVRSDGLVVLSRATGAVTAIDADGAVVTATSIAADELSTEEATTSAAASPEDLGFTVDGSGTYRISFGTSSVELDAGGRAVIVDENGEPLRRVDDNGLLGADARALLIDDAGRAATVGDNSTVLIDRDRSMVVVDRTATVIATGAGALVSEALVEEFDGETLTADDIADNIDVSALPDTYVLSVEFSASTPQLAIAGANGAVEAFKDLQQDAIAADPSGAIARTEQGIAELTQDLIEVEVVLGELRQVTGQDAQFAQQYEAILAELAEVGENLVSDQAGSDVETARIQQLLVQLDAIEQAGRIEQQQPAIVEANERRDELRSRIAELEAQRDGLRVGTGGIGESIAFISLSQEADEATGLGVARLAVVGAVLGVLVGAAAAYVAEVRSPNRLETPFEAERILAAPLLAEVPDYRHERIREALPVLNRPDSLVAEAYRIGAASLNVAARSRKTKLIGLVSASVGDGKTTVAANLAVALAQGHRRVLVIDSDLEGRALGGVLRQQAGAADLESPGLADVLRGETRLDEVITSLDLVPGVRIDLVTAGTETSTVRTLLGTDQWTRLFGEARRSNYDIVLVDVAPLLSVAYASRIVQELQGVIVVVPGGTPLRELNDLHDRLTLMDTPSVGLIHNRSEIRRHRTASVTFSGTGRTDDQNGWSRRLRDALTPRSQQPHEQDDDQQNETGNGRHPTGPRTNGAETEPIEVETGSMRDRSPDA